MLDVVLRQEGVEDWVRNVLSVQSHGKFHYPNKPAHEIWVCTGLVLVSRGTVTFDKEDSANVQALFNADIGALTTGVPNGFSGGEVSGGKGSDNETHVGYTQVAERVWAAQWQQLEVTLGPKMKDNQPKGLIYTLKQIETREPGFRIFEQGEMSEREHFDTAEVVGIIAAASIGNEADDKTSNEMEFDERPYAAATRDLDRTSFTENLKTVQMLW